MLIATIAASLCLTSTQKDGLVISAWFVMWNPLCYTRFEEQAGTVSEIMPEWIALDAEGMPIRRREERPGDMLRFWKTAKSKKVRTLAMVSNYSSDAGGFDSARVQKFLNSASVRANHIKEIVKIAKQDGFKGLDLDIESLQAGDKDGYSRYVEELSVAMKKARLFLSVTVHAKTDESGGWDGPLAQDWARLGKAADVVKLMCYDHSWSGSSAGPIAPDDWVEAVVTYAKTVIPAKKIDLGVAGYGYDWTKKPGASLKWEDWLEFDKEALDCPISGERISGERYFSGAAAFSRKRAMAAKLGIRGLALWYLGSEDPATWKR